MRIRYLLALVALLIAAMFAVTSSASAVVGDYQVRICDGAPDSGNEIKFDTQNLRPYFNFAVPECNQQTSGVLGLSYAGDPVLTTEPLNFGDLTGWRVDSPSNSLLFFGLHGAVQVVSTWTNTGVSAKLFNDGLLGLIKDYGSRPVGTQVQDGRREDVPFAPTRSVHMFLKCEANPCSGPVGNVLFPGRDAFEWVDPVLDVRDSDLPQFVSAPTGSLLTPLPGTVAGVSQARFVVRDGGSGPRRVLLTIDGQPQPEFANPSERCAEPFHFTVPCPGNLGVQGGSLTGTITVDTSALSDAQHSVVLSVEDASGRVTTQPPVTISVRNTPINTALPRLAGIPTFGRTQTLTQGTWTQFAATTFTDQWLRCPANVTAAEVNARCLPINGATGRTYDTTADDIGSRLALRETAQSGLKVASVVSEPSDVIAAAPGPPLVGARALALVRWVRVRRVRVRRLQFRGRDRVRLR